MNEESVCAGERKRKLASVQRVQSLTPIEGADRIEVARVLGWNVIVQKGLYKEGDLLVFCEIDSVFPKDDRWADLERYGYRVKTMKMKNTMSQGYAFPLDKIGSFEEIDGKIYLRINKEYYETTENCEHENLQDRQPDKW